VKLIKVPLSPFLLFLIFLDEITTVVVSHNNRFIISGSDDRSIKVYDYEARESYHRFTDAHNGRIYSIVVSSDNQFIFTGSEDSSIKMFDLVKKQEFYKFKWAHEGSNSIIILFIF